MKSPPLSIEEREALRKLFRVIYGFLQLEPPKDYDEVLAKIRVGPVIRKTDKSEDNRVTVKLQIGPIRSKGGL